MNLNTIKLVHQSGFAASQIERPTSHLGLQVIFILLVLAL